MVDQSHAETSGSSQVFMSGSKPIFVATKSKDYLPPERPVVEKETTDIPSSSTSTNSGPLHISEPINDSIIRPPPKFVLQKSSYNPNARAAQQYNIVEDLAQSPSLMSALEVLQMFPLQ